MAQTPSLGTVTAGLEPERDRCCIGSEQRSGESMDQSG